MMKFKLLLAVALFFPLFTNAQTPGFRMGGMFGVGESRIKSEGITNETGKLALTAGMTMTYQFSKNFGIYANALFTTKGTKSAGVERVSGIFTYTDYSYMRRFSLYYIEIPVMPKVSVGLKNFHLKAFAGPSLNFNILAKEDKEYDNQAYNNDYGYSGRNLPGVNVLEYSLVYGGGIDVEVSNRDLLFLEVRASTGITHLGSINGQDATNKYLMVGLGYQYTY